MNQESIHRGLNPPNAQRGYLNLRNLQKAKEISLKTEILPSLQYKRGIWYPKTEKIQLFLVQEVCFYPTVNSIKTNSCDLNVWITNARSFMF